MPLWWQNYLTIAAAGTSTPELITSQAARRGQPGMALDQAIGCNVICLRGNHEDAWLRVRRWDEFVFPPQNGCLAAYRSFTGGEVPMKDELPKAAEMESMFTGAFFPPAIAAWMESLPIWYEDEHAIYVHAGLVESVIAIDTGAGKTGGFLTAVELPSRTTYTSRPE